MVFFWIGAVWVILSVCLGLAWVLLMYEKPKVPIPTPDPPRDVVDLRVFQALKSPTLSEPARKGFQKNYQRHQ